MTVFRSIVDSESRYVVEKPAYPSGEGHAVKVETGALGAASTGEGDGKA